MRRFLRNLALMATVVLGAVSCEDADVDNTISITGKNVTFYASAPTAPSMGKAVFENTDGSGITMAWELGDSFSVFDKSTGAYVCDYECTAEATDDVKAVFNITDVSVALSDQTTYSLVYPASADKSDYETTMARDLLSAQDGDAISSLNNSCVLTGEITYQSKATNTISFVHNKAVMTFKFKSEVTPAELVFEEGKNVYTVSFTNPVADQEGVYTSHIMIEPSSGTRELVFSLYDTSEDGAQAYDVRSVTSSKTYLAGYRYTATVSNLENEVFSGLGLYDDPYMIENASQLRALSADVAGGETYSGVYFELADNIDLNSEEFTAIGNSSQPFSGVFNGDNKTISNLKITGTANYQGLFGYVSGATIKNLTVSGEISATGYSNIGGVVGCMSNSASSTVDNCHSQVKITGQMYLGGVVGYAKGSSTVSNQISNCSFSGSVVASSSYAGGIVGYLKYSTLSSCETSSVASVKGDYRVGGIAGSVIYSKLISSANLAGVTGTSTSTYTYNSSGGVAGYVSSSNIASCYNVGAVSSTNGYHAEIAGYITGAGYTISGVYDSSDSKVGVKTVQSDTNSTVGVSDLKSKSAVTELNNQAYTFNEANLGATAYAWVYSAGSYPTLGTELPAYIDLMSGTGTEEDPYMVSTAAQLRDISAAVAGGETYEGVYFQLANDIDLKSEEFTAIGNSTTFCFSGTFNGDNKTISNLKITASVNDQGLFGYVEGATIKNLTVGGEVVSASICNNIGGVVGFMYGSPSSTLDNCHSSVSVTGGGYVGGVVGYAYGGSKEISHHISNCSFSGSVEARSSYAGGIAGRLRYATLSSCETSPDASVKGIYHVGGIAGYVYESKLISSANLAGVTGTSTSTSSYYSSGGVVGYVSNSNIVSCYNAGLVSSANGCHAQIAGYITGAGCTVSGVYDSSDSKVGVKTVQSGTNSTVGVSDLKSESVVTTLNSQATTYDSSLGIVWKYVASSYPQLN